MPKVKQVDFNLNAILTEIIGADEDLHREIMSNFIEGQPYEFKVIPVTKDILYVKKGNYVTFRVDALGKGLLYQWYYKAPDKDWVKLSGGNVKNFYRQMTSSWGGWKVRCTVRDKFGNVGYSNVITINLI